MARTQILKKDGSVSPYYWTDDDGKDPASRTVFKKTPDGIKRMRGIMFDSVENKLRKP